MISSVLGPRRSSKASPKDKLALKNRHGHCLVVCFWSDPPRFSESQWNHCIWEVCSVNWWDVPNTATLAAGIGQQNGPNSSPCQCLTVCRPTNASKVEQIGLQSFSISAIFTWSLANRLLLLQAPEQLFAEKNASTTSIKHGFLCYRNKLTACWQKCVSCNGSYFD